MKVPQPQYGRLILTLGLTLFTLHLLCGLAFCQPALPGNPYLDSYSFSDTNWLSDEGYAPLAFTNLVFTPVWGGALQLDTTNELPAFLAYPIIQTNGSTNLSFPAGGLLCVFIPDWATDDTNQLGTGPGTTTAYLLGAGDFSSGSPDGLWRVYFDSAGSNIYFGGLSNFTPTVYVSAPISWPAYSMHVIGVSYSTNSVLYLDGEQVATGGPVTIIPATNVWTNGFNVGSDASGYEQAQGIFWGLEFFNSNLFDYYDYGAYFTNSWPWLSNSFASWLAANSDFDFGYGDSFSLPPATIPGTTNYNEYTYFWLAITNSGTNAVVSVMNTLPGFSYTVLTNYDLNTTNWGVFHTFTATNLISPCPSVGLSSNQIFFNAELNRGGQSLWVCSNVAPEQLVSWLMGTNPVIVTNITYTGCSLAVGVFTNAAMVGASYGLPGLAFDRGVILSTGWITNALGPNNNDGENGWDGYANDDYTSPSDLAQYEMDYQDPDLSGLVGTNGIHDTAVLEFDIITTSSFQLTFDYVFASEEYPEWIGDYNDTFAIFVTTNFVGTNWVNGIANDIALVPGTNLTMSVNHISGGCTDSAISNHVVQATNPQYYIDNHGYYDSLDTWDAWGDVALSPYAAAAPVYNLQYDGFTVPLIAQTNIAVGITNHVKIAIGDCSDHIYDSAVFIKAAVPAGFTCE